MAGGNIHSIAGSYWFDERMNRTIAVPPAFLRAALEQVCDTQALLTEIDGGQGSQALTRRPGR
ncbi:MAG: hypothetical protein EPO25_00575 [Gammaproteobacteria bacterium]|nr:MAG: hypothetical protein EPO25_00575 [Gammaproteobacteria bacterium]